MFVSYVSLLSLHARTIQESLRSWEYPAPSRAAETLKEHGVDSASRLLDLGCGTGMLGDALRETGFEGEIEGVDISQASLEFAMAKPGVYATTYAGSLDAPMYVSVPAPLLLP